MHVIVNSEVGGLESTNQFLWQLCDPMQLTGESGYYLTVFSSILSLIIRVDPNALPNATSLDDAIREDQDTSAATTANEEDSGWKKKMQFWK